MPAADENGHVVPLGFSSKQEGREELAYLIPSPPWLQPWVDQFYYFELEGEVYWQG